MNVLAIDQGTSATKAVVIGSGGTVLSEGNVPVKPRVATEGSVTQDPQELLDSILEAGRIALRGAGANVEAVGLGNQGETVLAWDRATGAPLGEAISWQDRRAATIVRELGGHAERLAELTGLPLDPYFAAPKMAWLRRRTPTDAVITTIDCWATHQLTGAFVTDAATASRTMLLDLESCEWSLEACEIFGLAADQQPQLVGNAEVVGETGAFGRRLPVTGLIVDQQAALLAQSCLETGDAKCTYGTGAFILANAGSVPPRPRTGLAASVAWKLPGALSFCLDGQVYTAAAAVSWLQELGLLRDPHELDALRSEGARLSDAPIFVPALAGLGAPYWAPEARGGWVGLSLATGARDLVDAVIWGIAAQITSLAKAVERDLGTSLTRLRVDGGLSRSARMLQAQADLLQIPIERYPSPDATSRGVAALALLGSGATSTLKDAIGSWVPSGVFEPRIGPDQAAEQLARYEAAARALIELQRPAR
jgi:glycerol kinase